MEDIGPIGLLKTIGDGRVMDDFHEQLSMLLMAVRMAHKKGHVTLKVVVSPTKDAEIPRVSIWGDVTSKIPHIERTSEFFYVDGDNRLSRRNPRQPQLPPNTVQMPPAEERVDLDRKSFAAGEKA